MPEPKVGVTTVSVADTGMANWDGIQRVVVVGLGLSGLSTLRYLTSLPYSLTIQAIDTRTNIAGLDTVDSSIELHLGGWQLEWLYQADLIVLAPGMALSTLEIQQAIVKGIKVVGDIELFAWHVNAPVIGITGSNGKSTVTDLTGKLARAAGLKVAVGGNIGVPALDILADDVDLYVLELSSFQLETTYTLALDAAVYLNLTEDHMDRYCSLGEYGDAKQRIFLNAKKAIVNTQDRYTYPKNGIPTIRFGFSDSEIVSDFTVVTERCREYLAKGEQCLLAADQLQIVGRHNVLNALASLAALDSLGIHIGKTLLGLTDYTGLEHRCQKVAERDGVVWVNDSKATNVASTLAAISGIKLQGILHLLVGGQSKEANLSKLRSAFSTLNIKLYCFGEDGKAFLPLHTSSQYFFTMDEAIQAIRSNMKSGDMVMLSPACASFDQFDNFIARGRYFTQLAQQ